MDLIAIGQAAARIGLNTSALRYYDERGLVPVPTRRAGQRCYGLEELSRLTFDTPGFSRSHVQTAEDISVSKLAEQIAGLVEFMGTYPTTFYGCNSGG